MQQVRLQIEQLHVSYGKTIAVDSFNLSMGNETVVLFGPSGCGKTTILKAVLGVSEQGLKVTGEILLDGRPIPKNKGTVGMVFQGPVLPAWMLVKNLCRMGCNMEALRFREQEERVCEMLERFEIGHLANRYPYQLSGGQKQRVALAVTLLNQPQVLLLDEPTTFLDGVSKAEVWNFIEEKIRASEIPIIIVSHDPTETIILGDRIFSLSKQAVVNKILEIDHRHPRNESISQTDFFWEIKHQLLSS